MLEKVFFCYERKDDLYSRLLNKEYQRTIYLDRTNNFIKNIDLNSEDVLSKIRNEVLEDTVVTIFLVGKTTLKNTEFSKIAKASMIEGEFSGPSGIIVIYLPEMKNIENKKNYLPEVILNNIEEIKIFEWDEIDWVKFSYEIKKQKQKQANTIYKI